MIPPERMYPAGVAGISARFIHLPSGLTMRLVEAGPLGGAAVVLVHGWGASAYTFRAAIPALAAAGHRVVAVDLPGHGLSDKPRDAAQYTHAGMAAAVSAVLELLDVRGACVVGQSMGGAIALELARAHDARVDRIALVNPVCLGPLPLVRLAQLVTLPVIKPWAHHFVPRFIVEGLLRLAYSDASRVSDADVDEYWAPSQFPDFAAAVIDCLHSFSWAPFTADVLAPIRCPVLLIVGTADHLVRGAERGAWAIKGLRVVRVAGGHAVNEECPSEVNAVLLDFARE
jgi:pimeloyl-ACP methyl ester carboxylesterase